MRSTSPLSLTLILLWLLAPAALAHGLDVIAQRSGDEISGIATYTNQTPAAGLFIEAVDAGNASISLAEGQTSSDGRFRLHVQGDGPLRVIVEGEEGHRAQALVSVLPTGPADSQALLLLREDIIRLEQRLWWRDVIGGLGYLLGVLGLWALWRSRQRPGGRF